MPTPHKTTGNMRKHLTKAERKARESVEAQLERKTRVTIRAPRWLGVKARAVFESTKRRMKGLNLLDNADADLLALYSDAVVKYTEEEDVRDKQAWSRIALSYAEKLGISPSARARLAKKAAEQAPPDPMELLFDEVTEFVNGSGTG
jgi:phage terminase small subunit